MESTSFQPTTAVAGASTPLPIVRTWEMPDGIKVAHVNGYEMAYLEQGSGQPIILVHGAGVDYRYWAGQMAAFSAKHRAIAVSLRHYYPEPWRGNGNFSLNQHIEDLVTFIKQLDAGPVHLVGHSRGGTAGLYTTLLIPGMVRTLTFAEGGTGMPAFSSADPASEERRRSALGGMSENLLKGETDAGLRLFIDLVNGPGAWNTLPEASKNSLRDNAWTLAAVESDIATWAPISCDEVAEIKAPVLLLEGESSPAPFKATLDKFEKCLAYSTRNVIKDSSHSMPRMNPQAFNTAVLEFVATH